MPDYRVGIQVLGTVDVKAANLTEALKFARYLVSKAIQEQVTRIHLTNVSENGAIELDEKWNG